MPIFVYCMSFVCCFLYVFVPYKLVIDFIFVCLIWTIFTFFIITFHGFCYVFYLSSLCIFMYNFIIGCLHFGINFCAFVYVVFLFCYVTNYIQCCAIGPIKFDGKDTIYSSISCSQGQH